MVLKSTDGAKQMITYIARKGQVIEFNGNLLDTLSAEPEETRAIVRKDNGKFAIAHYSYVRFGTGCMWAIWSDEEYSNQFKAMIALGTVKFVKFLNKWVISDDNARYA